MTVLIKTWKSMLSAKSVNAENIIFSNRSFMNMPFIRINEYASLNNILLNRSLGISPAFDSWFTDKSPSGFFLYWEKLYLEDMFVK